MQENNQKNEISRHRLYQTWNNMIQRCNNPKSSSYMNYGARGINVCDRWLIAKNFINDMYPTFQEGLTLDRINTNKNYEPDNCRWATLNVQHRNTRKIYNHNTSGYRGVSWYRRDNLWVVRIRINSKNVHIGRFNDILEAAKAYDNYVIANNLEHTKNF